MNVRQAFVVAALPMSPSPYGRSVKQSRRSLQGPVPFCPGKGFGRCKPFFPLSADDCLGQGYPLTSSDAPR